MGDDIPRARYGHDNDNNDAEEGRDPNRSLLTLKTHPPKWY
jgi:hypothetical protein